MLNFVEQMENYYGMPIDRILKEVKWDSAELDWGEPVGPEIMGEETLLADEHASEQAFWVNKINSVFQDNIYISDAEAIALDQWVEKHLQLRGAYSLEMVSDAACEALKRGVVDYDDVRKLLKLFGYSFDDERE